MNHEDPMLRRPLSIAVVGAGAIGSTFAWHLARAGHDVTAIVRPGSNRQRQLQRDGGVVRDSAELAALRVADRLDEQQAYDLVLVTVLGHQVDAVLPMLARSKAAAVQFMFNTFEPERLLHAVGAERCSLGMPMVMSTLTPEGRLRSEIGPGQRTLHGDKRWCDLFALAGVPSAFEPQMASWLRSHVPMCIAMESICAAGERRGGGASWSESLVVARGLRAGFAIVQALDLRLHPRSKRVLAASPVAGLAGMLWAVSRIGSFRRLLATGVRECRALVDVVARAASEAKPPRHAAAATLLAAQPADPG